MSIVEALQGCALFREFSETGLQIIATIASERSLPAGAPLFLEDTPGESMFIVKAGAVRITRSGADGERTLAVAGPGEALGALSLLARGVRLVSAVADQPTEVVEIAQRDYYRLQPQKPQACLKLALAIASDLARRMADEREALRSLAAGGN